MYRKDYYSPFKIAHHRQRLETLKKGELILPTQVMLNITDRCNHKCVYCYTKNVFFQRTSKELELDRIITLLNEFKELNIKSIQITGGGEPSIHKNFTEIIKHLNKLNLRLGLVCNGTGIKDTDLEYLECADWIRFSVDAATKDTYLTYHGVDQFEYIKNLTQKISKLLPEIVLGWSFVITPINYKEIYLAAKLSKELGANNIRITPAHTQYGQDLFKDIWQECLALVNQAKTLEDDNFTIFSQMNRIDDLKSVKKNYNNCYYQQFVAYISANGNLYPCCELQTYHTSLGNIYNASFKEVWFNRTPLPLSQCPRYCYFNRQNEFIEYLLTDSPPHVDYV